MSQLGHLLYRFTLGTDAFTFVFCFRNSLKVPEKIGKMHRIGQPKGLTESLTLINLVNGVIAADNVKEL